MKKELYRVGAVLLYAALLGLTAAKCHGQSRFKFTTESVTDHTDGAEFPAAVQISAYADTLEIIFPPCPGSKSVHLLWWGVDWVWTDDGTLYYNAPEWQAKYSPAGDLWVKTAGLNMTFSRRKTSKL